jgi:dolichyl-phosphate-mannose--protein O-mannosyl transferase
VLIRRAAKPPLQRICVGAVLFAATLALRGWELGRPGTFVYDEIFYANDAVDLLVRGVESTRVGHPPLGKWLIGLGVLVGGFSPTGWRLASLVAGAFVVVLVFACVVRLTSSTWLGISAACLVLSDGIAHEMGRYAFLDGFVSMFTTALMAMLVLSWDRPPSHRWALILGLLCGAALATKWSAAPLVVLVVVVAAERTRRARGARFALVSAALLLGSAVGVFVLTYSPWLLTGARTGNCTVPACRGTVIERIVRLPSVQRDMLESDALMSRSNPLLRPGWEWALQLHAMPIFREPCRGAGDHVCGSTRHGAVVVTLQGNRVLWLSVWPAAGAWLAWGRRKSKRPALVLLSFASAVALWLPWLVLRNSFLYYAAPMVPALAVFLMASLADSLPRRVVPLVATAIAVAAIFAFVVNQPAAPWRA